ncbi:MAG: hypothetical protein L6N96_03200 [Candidatus Methylarchaceae archaeon HK02M2]|nr:hypothetical protein [Candidatus Methylarchaceae archaeon HK02M2]
MKKTIPIIVVVLFTFALASVSFAAEKKAEMAKPTEKPKVHYVDGKVKALDTEAQTITIAKNVKGKEQETIITTDKETSFTLGKEKKMLADVKIGNYVAVKYTEVEGKNLANKVAIRPIKKIAKVESKKKIVESGKETGK